MKHVWIKYHHFCESEEALVLSFAPLRNTPIELGRVIKKLSFTDWCMYCRIANKQMNEATTIEDRKKAKALLCHWGGLFSDKWK